MDTYHAILNLLDNACRKMRLTDYGDITWQHGQQLRTFTLRAERGDSSAWTSFSTLLQSDSYARAGFWHLLNELGIVWYSDYHDRMNVTLPDGLLPFTPEEETAFLALFNPPPEPHRKPSLRGDPMRGDVMYIEWKPGLSGHARIGRVRKSATGKTIYYMDYVLTSLKGAGYKANFVDEESGMQFWVSNCRKDGNDTLYPGVVEIDPNAQEEYWTRIRRIPEKSHLTSFRSAGKYSKRRPC